MDGKVMMCQRRGREVTGPFSFSAKTGAWVWDGLSESDSFFCLSRVCPAERGELDKR